VEPYCTPLYPQLLKVGGNVPPTSYGGAAPVLEFLACNVGSEFILPLIMLPLRPLIYQCVTSTEALTMHLFLSRPAPMPNPPAMMNYGRHQTVYNVYQRSQIAQNHKYIRGIFAVCIFCVSINV